MLRLYWRLSIFLGVLVLGAILGWVVPLWAQLISKAIIRVWPLAILGLVLVSIITWAARQAHLNGDYYDFLDRSENTYRGVRKNSANIGAQLQLDREAMVKRFDEEIYTERTDAATAFDAFLRQKEKRIFLVVGPGGVGKSTFLQHRMGELSGALPSRSGKTRRHPCVYIDCKSERVAEDHPLMDIVGSQLECNLRELEQNLAGRGHQPLVIFVDAINENNAQEDINHYLTRFATTYLNDKHPIYLCVSVRQAYWDEQRRRYDATSEAVGWLEYVYQPKGKIGGEGNVVSSAGVVGVLMREFDDDEFEKAYDRYSTLYGVTGRIHDPRMYKICRNPLMLRMLCMALRGQNISGRILLRELDIFDAYAKSALEGVIKRIGVIDQEPTIRGESLPERAIRGPVLELALGMVKRGRPFLTYEEALEILRREVPDALIVGRPVKTVNDLFTQGSLLKAILDEGEGLVLETGKAKVPGRGRYSIIRFVHERYFEYSIGRALARRWCQQELGSESILKVFILKDFEGWMQKHDELMARGFTNLRQGLGIAVLEAEEPQEGLPEGIHYALLERLAQDKNFTWNQLACQRILQLRVLNDPSSSSTEEREERSEKVKRLLNVVDIMGGKNDFVLRWDIERVLLHMVDEGERQAVLQQLQKWCRSEAPFSQQLFGTECLGYLFKRSSDDYRVDVVEVLKRVVDSSQLNFWIRRSLMFSIGTMLDALDERDAPEAVALRIRRNIVTLAEKLLKTGQSLWDRSIGISVLLSRDALHDQLNNWSEWNWKGEEVWTCTNAVLALEQACVRGSCTGAAVKLLRYLWDSQQYSPHLNWALTKVLQQAIDCAKTPNDLREQAKRLREEVVKDSRAHHHIDERAEWVTAGASAKRAVDTSVAIVYHPEYAHIDLHNHPESKERVEAIVNFLDSLPLPDGRQRQEFFRYVSPLSFHDDETWNDEAEGFLRMVHEEEWIRRVRDLSEQLKRAPETNLVLESDLEVRAGSYEGACLAVRGALCAVDLVLSATGVKLAIALLRPPGHLAGNKICIFNNIAVAAKYAQQQGKQRILIVDCDAHHGKSTHDIFYHKDESYKENSVVYFSTHQAGVHPGTGRFDERGDGSNLGYIVNVPIPAYSGDRVYEEVLDRILKPLLEGFEPELILVSMGLDAYYQDDFSQLEFSEFSYFALAQVLWKHCQQRKGLAVVAALEGGYALQGMGPCVLQFMKVFGQWTPLPLDLPLERRGSSTLDQYLSGRDEGGAPIELTDDEKEWQHNLERLETSIKQQLW